jgi:hypothetical protein
MVVYPDRVATPYRLVTAVFGGALIIEGFLYP